MEEDFISKIAEVYVFDNSTDSGFYNSYRNFCLKNIVRLDFVYGSKNIRVNSSPVKYTISDAKSDEIKSLFKKYFSKLHKIDEAETDNIKKYFLIEYVNGNKEYYNYDDDFNQIFTCDESNSINKDPNIISTPYLIFDNNKESYKYQVINYVGACIAKKDFNSIYKYLSNNCSIKMNNKKLSGINEIKNEIKNRTGFLNSKLRKISFYNIIMGYLNNGISDICLKIELTDDHYKTNKYVLYFEFNKNNFIEEINIELFDEKAPMKMILEDNLNKLLNSRYNDYKND